MYVRTVVARRRVGVRGGFPFLFFFLLPLGVGEPFYYCEQCITPFPSRSSPKRGCSGGTGFRGVFFSLFLLLLLLAACAAGTGVLGVSGLVCWLTAAPCLVFFVP